MTPEIMQWVGLMRSRYITNPGVTLEVGSQNINGGVRHIFHDASPYIGIDIIKGNGVDLVLSGHNIVRRFGADSFDTIICLETIEHDQMFWLTISNIREALKQDGYLFLSSPTINFPLHYPPDYWRFTEEGIKNLIDMASCELLVIAPLRDMTGSISIAAIGKRK